MKIFHIIHSRLQTNGWPSRLWPHTIETGCKRPIQIFNCQESELCLYGKKCKNQHNFCLFGSFIVFGMVHIHLRYCILTDFYWPWKAGFKDVLQKCVRPAFQPPAVIKVLQTKIFLYGSLKFFNINLVIINLQIFFYYFCGFFVNIP